MVSRMGEETPEARLTQTAQNETTSIRGRKRSAGSARFATESSLMFAHG
jgi:hypothetical protein